MAKAKDTKDQASPQSAKPQGDMPPASGQSAATDSPQPESAPKPASGKDQAKPESETEGPQRCKKWRVSLKHNRTRDVEFSSPVTQGEAIAEYNRQMGIISTPYQHSAGPAPD